MFTNTADAAVSRSEFDCPICLETAKNVVETDCCHKLFCEACLDAGSRCPICRSGPPVVARPSVAVRRIIGNLPAKCPHSGCTTAVTMATLDEHARKCRSIIPRKHAGNVPASDGQAAVQTINEHISDMHDFHLPSLPILGTAKVLYKFDGGAEGTIAVRKGELVYLLDKDWSDGWTHVRRADQEQGCVPTAYLEAELIK